MRIGIRPREHVALWAGNWPEWVVLQPALAKLNAVAVPLPVPLSPDSLERLVRHADARALLLGNGAPVEKETWILKSLIPELEVCPPGQLHSERFPELRSIINLAKSRHPGMHQFKGLADLAELVPKEELARVQEESSSEDPAAIFCDLQAPERSLGTTLTHRILVQKARAVGRKLGARVEDRVLLPHPLFDIHGMVCGSTLALVNGATLLPLVDWRSREVLRAAAEERATIVVGTSSMFEHLLKEQRAKNWTSQACAQPSWSAPPRQNSSMISRKSSGFRRRRWMKTGC